MLPLHWRVQMLFCFKRAIELNLFPCRDALPSLYAWHACDIWKNFCQKTIAKSVKVSIELSEDCYCDFVYQYRMDIL